MKRIIFATIILILIFAECQNETVDLKFETDYLEALQISEEEDKPLFIAFTSEGCLPEPFIKLIASEEELVQTLNNRFIVAYLRVDDNKILELKEIENLKKYDLSAKSIEAIKTNKTLGRLNGRLQIDLLGHHSQPSFAILNSKKTFVIKPFSLTQYGNKKKLVTEMKRKLKEGLSEYSKINGG